MQAVAQRTEETGKKQVQDAHVEARQGQQVRSAAVPEHPDRLSAEPAPVAGEEGLEQRGRGFIREGNPVDESAQLLRGSGRPALQEGGLTAPGERCGQETDRSAHEEGREKQSGPFRLQDGGEQGGKQEEESSGEGIRVHGQAHEQGPGRDSGREMDCQRPYVLPLRHFLQIRMRK